MNLMRTNTYTRVAKEDPDELRHQRAQYMINKVLQEADEVGRKRQPFKLTLRKLKTKISVRIKRLRKSIRSSLSRVQACFHWNINKRLNYCNTSLRRKNADSAMLIPLFG